MKICFLAAPLMARSGVYNSTVELVRHARAFGLDWSAVLGVSEKAGGIGFSLEGVREFAWEPSGAIGILRLRKHLAAFPEVESADLVISMVPQADMAMAIGRDHWVAYLRGLPWPGAGEASGLKTLLWKTLESVSLRRADEVWATTRILANQVGGTVTKLVPPGLTAPDIELGEAQGTDIVWAARYAVDKNPHLFVKIMRQLDFAGAMYGSGPLENELRNIAPDNVTIGGWVPRHDVWASAKLYVGTSTREAFGRSAVEAAMLGIPVVVSDQFGCAESLYTDQDLFDRFVLPLGDHMAWSHAVKDLVSDEQLFRRVSTHIRGNAKNLTIEAAVQGVAAAASASFGAS